MDLQPEHAPSGGSDPGGSERRLVAISVALFAVVVTLATVDLMADSGEGSTFRHLATEGALLLTGMLGLAAMLRRLADLRTRERAARAEIARIGARIESANREAERWRNEARELLHGLGAAIDRQLVHWGLTAAEQDIARLLLKGLSHKEVAVQRNVSEATVRQQSRAIYQKAGVDGRHELAAFFLEGLLVTPGDG